MLTRTTDDAISKILSLPRGAKATYHTGFLTVDRSERLNPDRAQQDETATIMWNLYQAGKVTLVQRRLGDREFEYIAVRL